ncbi:MULTISPECIES: hypothetical protein [Chryseobacterium]|uniref:Uncharacterized protein n=1 Tax=Chryseobacterium taihuense TaxID=1141221 RepID=A0A4U8WBA8_9FLAO|nr:MULTISPECIES: hypothetical protein [Chryseobacterium]QQV03894.1 hypothetical protein I6I61_06050 [Chryseobacterium sp. FDAARGOS 1104]VFB02756.1 Uncharacterised protein [Chryseobacterium taihuense]
MNISFYDFKNLPNQTQWDIAISEGRVMNERVSHSLKYVLYELSHFTVEIIYNTAKNKMEGLNVYPNQAVYTNF